MSIQTTTRTSYGSRIVSSLKGILVGIVLFIVGIPVLWLNEGRAVKTHKALKEGAQNVVSVEAATVDSANEGKLVHISGKAVTDDVLQDEQFGVSFNGIRLARNVEMFQWEEQTSTEKKKKLGGSEEEVTTYSYAKTWSSAAIDSSGFQEAGHDNPAALPFESAETEASHVTVGAFTLTSSQISRIGGMAPLPLIAGLPLPAIANISTIPNGFYVSKDGKSSPEAPAIGDVKVTFAAAAAQDISLCAVQTGASFKPYVAKNGRSIDLLANGVKTADEMFTSAQRSNKILTWIIRLIGFVLLYSGLSAVLAPLSVLADVIPFLGTLIGAGTKAVAFLLALVVALVVIAIAWIFYRPLLGITLLVIGGACLVLAISKGKAAKAAKAAAATVQTA